MAERWPAQTAGRCWGESENIRISSKAPPASSASYLAGRTTLNRFSIFSESGPVRMNIRSGGLKHCLGGTFLCFVSFGQAKEMNNSI